MISNLLRHTSILHISFTKYTMCGAVFFFLLLSHVNTNYLRSNSYSDVIGLLFVSPLPCALYSLPLNGINNSNLLPNTHYRLQIDNLHVQFAQYTCDQRLCIVDRILDLLNYEGASFILPNPVHFAWIDFVIEVNTWNDIDFIFDVQRCCLRRKLRFY